jgi:hypothetical protein
VRDQSALIDLLEGHKRLPSALFREVNNSRSSTRLRHLLSRRDEHRRVALQGTGQDLCSFELRPAAVLPIEIYTSERIAEFERESEVDADTRAAARKAVDTANG